MVYRLALSIDVPYDKFTECSLDTENLKVTGGGISIWEAKQRAYYFGQDKIIDRISTYNAMLHIASVIYKGEESDINENTYKFEQMDIAYDHIRPLARYAKARRKFVRSQRNKNGKSNP